MEKSKLLSNKSLLSLTDFDYPSNHRRSTRKKSRENTTVRRFHQSIRFHIQKKDELNTPCIWSLQKTIFVIMILYKNTKVIVRSSGGDTDFFDIIAGVLLGDTLASYSFILCQDYVLRTSIDKIKENGFTHTKKAKSRRYPAETMIYADYIDGLVLLTNTPTQAESRLNRQEQAARGIGLYVNANKTEYMCFKQKETVSTLSGKSLKLGDHFTYLGSIISSTESMSMYAYHRMLLTDYRSYLSDK